MFHQILSCTLTLTSLLQALSSQSTTGIIGWSALTLVSFSICLGLALTREDIKHENRHPIRYR